MSIYYSKFKVIYSNLDEGVLGTIAGEVLGQVPGARTAVRGTRRVRAGAENIRSRIKAFGAQGFSKSFTGTASTRPSTTSRVRGAFRRGFSKAPSERLRDLQRGTEDRANRFTAWSDRLGARMQKAAGKIDLTARGDRPNIRRTNTGLGRGTRASRRAGEEHRARGHAGARWRSRVGLPPQAGVKPQVTVDPRDRPMPRYVRGSPIASVGEREKPGEGKPIPSTQPRKAAFLASMSGRPPKPGDIKTGRTRRIGSWTKGPTGRAALNRAQMKVERQRWLNDPSTRLGSSGRGEGEAGL